MGTRTGHGGHGHGDSDRSMRVLGYALLINTVFFVVELAGALYADSLTLLADAVHMITDSASIALALFAAWVATRPADAKRTYGYQRAEVLGAFLNGLFLLATVGYILFEAYSRFQDPQPVRPTVVVVVGVLGLGANLAAAYVLSGSRDSLNVEGAFLHLLADAAGSVAAIAVGIALWFTDLYVLDPLFAVVIAALVLYSTADLLSDSLNILLQGTPSDVDVERVTAYLRELDGVRDAHDVHVWSLSSTEYTLSAHVVAADGTDTDALLSRLRAELHEQFDIGHATIQIETGDYSHVAELDCYAADDKLS